MRLKTFILALILLWLGGCAMRQQKLTWRVKDMVLIQSSVVHLQGPGEQLLATIPTRTLQELMLAHLRITRSARIEAELLIVEGEEPNAFAGMVSERRVIGINLGMIKLVGDDVHQYAALLGHEAAHWSKGHVEAGKLRENTLKVIGTIVSLGLSAAGVPASDLITGLSLNIVDASYNRDQEREADAAGVDYVIVNNYDPQGAITLFEKMMKNSSGFSLSFLSSHPSDQERIERFKALIESKRPLPSEAEAQ